MKPYAKAMREVAQEMEQVKQNLQNLESAYDVLSRINGRSPVSGSGVSRGRRRMSAAGRARIAAAQKARWAKMKGRSKKAA